MNGVDDPVVVVSSVVNDYVLVVALPDVLSRVEVLSGIEVVVPASAPGRDEVAQMLRFFAPTSSTATNALHLTRPESDKSKECESNPSRPTPSILSGLTKA